MVTVLDTTVKNTLCVGCGVCAGLCPRHALEMRWNRYGEYNPIRVKECGKGCGLCTKICPFSAGNKNEDNLGKELFSEIQRISHRMETGYYLDSGMGGIKSITERMHSVSGGMATWFLRQILRENIVDAVICAKKTGNPNKLFEFFIAKTDDDIYKASGSVYYPLELSKVIQYILENHGRYAIIALPCCIKSLRLAQEKNEILKKRITIMASLTCGHLATSSFAKSICACSNLNEEITYLHFREKGKDYPARSCVAKVQGVSGKESMVSWDKYNLWGTSWRYYDHFGCKCCDDLFGECADVTFMDAWVPECNMKPEGTSLWISRSPIVSDVISRGIYSGVLEASLVPIDKIIESQLRVGTIKKKKEMLHYRINYLENKIFKQHGIIPEKRHINLNYAPTFIEKYTTRSILRETKQTRKIMVKRAYDYNYMQKWFKKRTIKYRIISYMVEGILHPKKVVSFSIRKITKK